MDIKTLLREDGRLMSAHALARINELEKVCQMIVDKDVPIGDAIRAATAAMSSSTPAG